MIILGQMMILSFTQLLAGTPRRLADVAAKSANSANKSALLMRGAGIGLIFALMIRLHNCAKKSKRQTRLMNDDTIFLLPYVDI